MFPNTTRPLPSSLGQSRCLPQCSLSPALAWGGTPSIFPLSLPVLWSVWSQQRPQPRIEPSVGRSVLEEENTRAASLLCRWDSFCVLSIFFLTACVQRDFFGRSDGERERRWEMCKKTNTYIETWCNFNKLYATSSLNTDDDDYCD